MQQETPQQYACRKFHEYDTNKNKRLNEDEAYRFVTDFFQHRGYDFPVRKERIFEFLRSYKNFDKDHSQKIEEH